ncbi:hypothetical protein T01_8134 [Trichinella spiralis]|uniref:Uncharacterized protein n=1 Tax=Trichinella spiralis TaxID=6334 RepID=A0A0V1BTW0_TRISP|nr:hypothetical protein T01_8134 [Trichinella spiralis]
MSTLLTKQYAGYILQLPGFVNCLTDLLTIPYHDNYTLSNNRKKLHPGDTNNLYKDNYADIMRFLMGISRQTRWPSGLRRCVQVAVHSCGRGFESHSCQDIFTTLIANNFYDSVITGYYISESKFFHYAATVSIVISIEIWLYILLALEAELIV